MSKRIASVVELVNGVWGDPALYVDYPDRDNALLFDAGDVAALPKDRLADLDAVFLTHHHADHFTDLDRVVRANLDADKTLSIFGPAETINRVYERIRSYAHSYFPFQKLVLRLTEIVDDRCETATLHYQERFPPPQRQTAAFAPGDVIFENQTVRIRAAPTQHTVPGLAYGLEEKHGFRFRYDKLAKSQLCDGPWIAELIRRWSEHQSVDDQDESPTGDPNPSLTIESGRFSLKTLADRFLQTAGGYRIGWVVDTRVDGPIGDELANLVRGMDHLFLDHFYADAQLAAAKKHQHLTTGEALAFAATNNVQSVTPVHHSGRYRYRGDRLIREIREHADRLNVRLTPAESS